MTQATEKAVPVTVNLPQFVTIALNLLPRFVEAIGGHMGLASYKTIQYFPDASELAHDPEKGEVAFRFGGGYTVAFNFRYMPGEEGTRGSLSDIESVSLRNSDGVTVLFDYQEHRCSCLTCKGVKYPFRPREFGVSEGSFAEMTEDVRLRTIRDYVKKAKGW